MPDVDSTYIFVAGAIAGVIGWLINQLWDTVMSRQNETDNYLEQQIDVLEDEKNRLAEQVRSVSLEGRRGRQKIQEELKQYARADTVQALSERVNELGSQVREVRSLVTDVRVSQNKNFAAILDKLDE